MVGSGGDTLLSGVLESWCALHLLGPVSTRSGERRKPHHVLGGEKVSEFRRPKQGLGKLSKVL